MITKSALKVIWLGGGGLVATWLAVTPTPGVPSAETTERQRPAAAREATADDLNVQAALLRDRVHAAKLRPSTRNPFRFNSARHAEPPGRSPRVAPVTEPTEPIARPPALVLSGMAESATQDGPRRTAVISGDGQVYLVREGDVVAGRYTVIAMDSEAVVLRDAGGTELRLALHP